jgi:hypothetical protein
MKIVPTILICFVSLAAISSGRGQTSSPNFSKLMTANSLQYTLPPGFEPTAVISNRYVKYNYAIRSKAKKLEIRYRIWPLRKPGQQPGKKVNTTYRATLVLLAKNISNGRPGPIQEYPAETVKKEFGADAGMSTAIPCKTAFGRGYRNCLISVIHKDDVADAYAFFLFDEVSVLEEALMTDKTNHALRFR